MWLPFGGGGGSSSQGVAPTASFSFSFSAPASVALPTTASLARTSYVHNTTTTPAVATTFSTATSFASVSHTPVVSGCASVTVTKEVMPKNMKCDFMDVGMICYFADMGKKNPRPVNLEVLPVGPGFDPLPLPLEVGETLPDVSAEYSHSPIWSVLLPVPTATGSGAVLGAPPPSSSPSAPAEPTVTTVGAAATSVPVRAVTVEEGQDDRDPDLMPVAVPGFGDYRRPWDGRDALERRAELPNAVPPSDGVDYALLKSCDKHGNVMSDEEILRLLDAGVDPGDITGPCKAAQLPSSIKLPFALKTPTPLSYDDQGHPVYVDGVHYATETWTQPTGSPKPPVRLEPIGPHS